jgi:hypothetical protein
MFGSSSLPWSPEAEQAVEQALSQMPVPALLRGPLRSKLRHAAEDAARSANHTDVKPEDLMTGLLALLPANMRATIEQRVNEGPEGIKKLEDDLKNMKPDGVMPS